MQSQGVQTLAGPAQPSAIEEENCAQARQSLFAYIEVFYNRSRRHSHLGGISPEAFETAAA